MMVELEILTSSGSERLACQDDNDATQLASMMLAVAEAPMRILHDGVVAYDEGAMRRRISQICVY